jgi:D-alanine-D-alanine ligase-like ATP-grasp enzyme
MKKLSVCVLFGGISPEHEVSLRSAESVLNNIDKEKYCIFQDPGCSARTQQSAKTPHAPG